MPFLPQHRKSRIKIFIPLLFVIGGTLFLVATASPRFSSTLLTLATPFLRARAQIIGTEADALLRIRRDESVDEENARLREEVARLRMRATLYDDAAQETERLKELFGRTRAPGILAYVLASPGASVYDTFILDVGSAEGVRTGQRVLFDGTLAVGTIESVGEHVSRARLFSSPDTTYEVTVGTSTVPGTATGKGGGMFMLEVPRDVLVTPGMAVFQKGNGTEAFAFVVESQGESADAFQKVYAVFPINLFETREVIIEATPSREF